MNYLLDTHTFIWFLNGDKELSAHAKNTIENSRGNFLSVASLWEMAVKVSLGKLKTNTPFSSIPKQIADNGFQILPIGFEDTVRLISLPFHHRDPFDRLIIAQAVNSNLTIISKDKQFSGYDVAILW